MPELFVDGDTLNRAAARRTATPSMKKSAGESRVGLAQKKSGNARLEDLRALVERSHFGTSGIPAGNASCWASIAPGCTTSRRVRTKRTSGSCGCWTSSTRGRRSMGSRKMTEWLVTEGYPVNRKARIAADGTPGIEAVYPKPKLSQPGEDHRIYPYLLREQRWSASTSVEHGHHIHPDGSGFRVPRRGDGLVQPFVLSWSLSLDPGGGVLCGGAEAGVAAGTAGHLQQRPGFAVYQREVYRELAGRQIANQHGREGAAAMDNIFVERLWRSLKYEELYLKDFTRR